MGQTNKNASVLRGQGRPVEDYGVNSFPLVAVLIHCNIKGTYRVYSDKDHYTDRAMLSGLQYAGPFVKATTITNTAIAAGSLIIRF